MTPKHKNSGERKTEENEKPANSGWFLIRILPPMRSRGLRAALPSGCCIIIPTLD